MADFTDLTGVTNDEEDHNNGTQTAGDSDEEKGEVFSDRDFRYTSTSSWKWPWAEKYTLSAKQINALNCAVEIFNNDSNQIFTSKEKHAILRTLLEEQTASQLRNDLSSYSACRAFRKAFEAKPPTAPDFVQACTSMLVYDLKPPKSWPSSATGPYVKLLSTLRDTGYIGRTQSFINGLLVDVGRRQKPTKPNPAKPEKAEKKSVKMRDASAQCDILKPTTVGTQLTTVDDEPKLSDEQQELIDWVSKYTDNASLDSKMRLNLLLQRLADEKWKDLYSYAKHLTASEASQDERRTIFTTVLREMKARWCGRPTTLMPMFYDPSEYNVRLQDKNDHG
ncbi:hypothetical protein LX32DRAFT_657695 [Colletotrichum zoysiae]|uniref:Uncharacterized protein n=1 Tax=Colletotrichum zoysiae TaxID=1216348 RepID=A0AAD9H4S5_9PEZI|nr:hypothetical protein LX32DRAFT_657695 [Colletotrichum zoysiae]